MLSLLCFEQSSTSPNVSSLIHLQARPSALTWHCLLYTVHCCSLLFYRISQSLSLSSQ